MSPQTESLIQTKILKGNIGYLKTRYVGQERTPPITPKNILSGGLEVGGST